MVKTLIILNLSNMKKTVVIGASLNPARYSHLAVIRLKQFGHDVVAVGLRPGEIDGIKIQTGQPAIENVDTVTMYVGEKNQPALYDYIFSLEPKRVIFNPGAENIAFEKQLSEKGIETEEACTLTLLSTGQY
jgi:predicted CoA-binding protein